MSDERHDPFDDVPRDDPAEDRGFFGAALEEETAHEEDAVEAPRARRSRGGLLSCLVVVVVVAALVGGGAFALLAGKDKLQELFAGPEDYSGEGTGEVVFEVSEGESSAAIGRNLEEAGVVKSAEAFTEAADDNSKSRGIQVGFYSLRKKMSAEAALEVLVDPANLVRNTVTVPEGLRVEDTIELLAKKTDVPLRQFKRVLESPKRIGLPPYAKGNAEGYLFPATYAFAPNADAESMLSQMVDRWRQAAKEADLEARAKELGYTPGEVMIVASLVEAEANRPQDRGKVARVIYNRLETDATNRLLQIDATVNYALGRDLGLGLTAEDLQVDSPYNTRRYPGLPPGPIESPGDAAIEAAANPTPGDWIYYVTVNLDTGETKFTDDYDEFLRLKNVELAAFCDGSDRC
ncbi:MAG TPA: endolytic transglycosylase MltG [Marmoricola sp.]|nr:endolytic transglycosylase MltG [Marmoricola sp.]